MPGLVLWECGHFRSGYIRHHLRKGCPACGCKKIKERLFRCGDKEYQEFIGRHVWCYRRWRKAGVDFFTIQEGKNDS